jgi:hypothetical protein
VPTLEAIFASDLFGIFLNSLGEKRNVIQSRHHTLVNGIELNLQRPIRIAVSQHHDIAIVQ